MIKAKRPVIVDEAAGMATVVLTQGQFATIDIGDAEWVSQWSWTAYKSSRAKKFYAKRKERGVTVLLHVAIAARHGITGQEIDHKDTDTLNDRVANLRPATHSQNLCNRAGRAISGLKGVSWYRRRGKWRARISIGGRDFLIGLFDDPSEAALAYRAAAAEAHGEFSNVSHEVDESNYRSA